MAAGPFAGQLLVVEREGECEASVLLGAYECEVHEWVERELARGWSVTVNVGSALGLYSTGAAMRLPGATVYAFEADGVFRERTMQSADLNGVADRVRALGFADAAALAALPVNMNHGALVFCDCEGCECDLLDPARVPWLHGSALCVELHDFAAPGVTEILRERFGETHFVEFVEQAPRNAAVWAARAGISEADAALMCNERRTWGATELPGRWLLASPRR